MHRLTTEGIKGVLTAVADIVMPRKCVVCGRTLMLDERYICTGCRSDLPFSLNWEMSRNPMADRFNELLRENVTDGEYEPYAYAAALFHYDSKSPFSHIPRHLKYGYGISEGRFFADMLADRLTGSTLFRDVDTVIPVPLHPVRKFARGYNQSEIIASRVAEMLGARLETAALVRKKSTRTQTELNAQERYLNVFGAFSLRRIPESRHILLVDDTFTTGATLAACHLALRQGVPPATRISIAALAYIDF